MDGFLRHYWMATTAAKFGVINLYLLIVDSGNSATRNRISTLPHRQCRRRSDPPRSNLLAEFEAACHATEGRASESIRESHFRQRADEGTRRCDVGVPWRAPRASTTRIQ